ncbi:MAG: molybdopterin-guanine dinucleotide biosynthesis protein B [Gammaproteobacteria bacterium]|nr:molybdopterin-guanine dinucleotide biosynthesis protein B [Gammaproteobacteria bacterium]
MTINYPKPVIGFAAYSGTGKTTLLTQLIPILRDKGLRVAVIKHAHHDFDIDQPGKDSYQLRKAGASPMLISSSRRMALMIDKEDEKEPELAELIHYIHADTIDLILVEGFKHESIAKIELHRPATGKPLLFPDDDNIIAIAHDDIINSASPIPRLDINNPVEIADFLFTFINSD